MSELEPRVPGAKLEDIGELVMLTITDRKLNGEPNFETSRKYYGVVKAYHVSQTQFAVQLEGVTLWQMVPHISKHAEVVRLDKHKP